MELNEIEQITHDSIEVTTIGGGVNGESIVLNLGNSKWAIVDSCVSSVVDKNLPLPLYYLRSIGVDFSNVVLVVCTHWHYDHICGLDQILRLCSNAKFVMGKVGNFKDYISLLYNSTETDHEKAGTQRIFFDCMSALSMRSGMLKYPEFVMCNSLVYHSYYGDKEVNIVAMSPSGQLLESFDKFLLKYEPDTLPEKNKDVEPVVDPNMCSITLLLQVGEINIVLGADLERNDPKKDSAVLCNRDCEKYSESGWCNALQSIACSQIKKIDCMKISHHSSKTGFCPALWENKSPYIASSSLYTKSHRLPNSTMLDVYMKHSHSYYLTSVHKLQEPEEPDNMLFSENSRFKTISANPGIICAILDVNSNRWTIAKAGDACLVTPSVIESYAELETQFD